MFLLCSQILENLETNRFGELNMIEYRISIEHDEELAEGVRADGPTMYSLHIILILFENLIFKIKFHLKISFF